MSASAARSVFPVGRAANFDRSRVKLGESEARGISRPEMMLQQFSETPVKIGWDGRVRTSEWRNQNPLPYHLATSQCRRRTGTEAPAERHHNQSRLGGQWRVAMRATRAVEGSSGLWVAAFRLDFDFSVAPKSGACGGIKDGYNAPLPGAPYLARPGRKPKFRLLVGRSVAQPGSALASGARGRRFKSSRSDQSFQ